MEQAQFLGKFSPAAKPCNLPAEGPKNHIPSLNLKSMLFIHFFRVGKKNQAFFKIVVAEKGKPTRAGRFVEELGTYNPITKEKVLKQDRIKYWLSVGAQASNTVHNLLISEKIIEGKKIDVHKKSKKIAEKPTAPAAPASQTTTPVPEVKPAPAPAAPVPTPAPASAETTAGKEQKPAAKPTKPEPPK